MAVFSSFWKKGIFFFGIKSSEDQIRHKYDRQNSNFDECELLRLAKEFSFKARFVDTDISRLDKIVLPAIAQTKEGTYFIVGKVAGGKVLHQFV